MPWKNANIKNGIIHVRYVILPYLRSFQINTLFTNAIIR